MCITNVFLIEMYFLLLKVLLHDDKNYNKREISIFFGIIYLIINIYLSFVSKDLWFRFYGSDLTSMSIKLLSIPRCTIQLQASLANINNLDIGPTSKRYYRSKQDIYQYFHYI